MEAPESEVEWKRTAPVNGGCKGKGKAVDRESIARVLEDEESEDEGEQGEQERMLGSSMANGDGQARRSDGRRLREEFEYGEGSDGLANGSVFGERWSDLRSLLVEVRP